MASLQRRLTENLDLLNDNAARASDLAFTQSEILQRSARAQLIFVVVFAVAASLVMGYFTTRSILTPINQLLTRVQAIMRRDFSHVDPLPRRDEFGQLSQAMTLMTDLLKETYRQLEQKVAERTRALKTSAEVSRRLSTILDPRHLAIEVVEQLQSAFNYYHAHIYFFDEARENLVMAGGTGEAGKALLERGHRIPRGRGLVGRAAETNEVILAPDISQEPDWLPNPLLPETRSEIAVPIAAGNQVVGVLDVQNDTAGSLGQEDADLILTIADQVAVAVQNARLYAETETSKSRVQAVLDAATQLSIIATDANGLITVFNTGSERMLGYSSAEMVGRHTPAVLLTEEEMAARSRELTAEFRRPVQGLDIFTEYARQGRYDEREWSYVRKDGTHFTVSLIITAQRNQDGEITGYLGIAQDITERRQLEQLTVQRARQQEAINLITQRIQGAATVEMALQIAARELGHALGQKQT
ncbi:MAG: PAS domain S-box protein, partial [Chloroflexota bacterium]